jgi:hypothetical protein
MVSLAANKTHRGSQALAFLHNVETIANLERFLLLAKEIELPVIVCEAQFVDQTILETLVEKLGKPISGQVNPALLLCGANLEEQVSLAAQHFLIAGFDVRLIRDLVFEGNPRHAHIHDQRMTHAGIVPITLKQLIYEWVATETNPSLRVTLVNFLESLE